MGDNKATLQKVVLSVPVNKPPFQKNCPVLLVKKLKYSEI